MAIDKPCSFGCGRWARKLSDICEVCAGNQSRWKGERPIQRLKYRQRLALATRRQTTYADSFGDPPNPPDIEMIEPEGKGRGRRKADVIPINRKRNNRRKKA